MPVQNAYNQEKPRTDLPRGLVCVNRSEGRLFPDTNSVLLIRGCATDTVFVFQIQKLSAKVEVVTSVILFVQTHSFIDIFRLKHTLIIFFLKGILLYRLYIKFLKQVVTYLTMYLY